VDVPQPGVLVQSPALARAQAAEERVFTAQNASQRALQNLELKREAYRTALDANEPAQQLRREYKAAEAAYAAAQQRLAEARREAAAAAPEAEAARRAAMQDYEDALHRQQRDSFLWRLAFVLATILGAYGLLAWMRRRASRWFPLAGSVVAYATILAFVLACDYLTDYWDPFQWGILVIAVIGIATTLLAYLAVQRYLVRRIPQRRVKKRQCPFCGYPLGANDRCEGCGREVVAPCAKCESPRRVGTAHCGVCGATS
jgi:hypothetical protein